MAEASAERGRATRQRLLQAAVPLVGEVGWGAVTTRLVAERAGVNPALVHYHFASVTDLLIAACTGHARLLIERSAKELTEHADVSEGVDWLLGELSRYSGTDPESLPLVEAFLAAGRIPGLRAELAVIAAEFRAHVAEWLRAHGHDHDADALAGLLAAVVDGVILHRTVDPDLDVAAMVRPLRRLFTQGVTP
ncbi:TetR/AcrR family transcriptional regulator [Nonomuraea africana]|uniref:AcrR family transcriptional regulator n=1 Tax=Nonomuraea africana TaxID=46171 RepID=A0ABR9KBW8_9ACTN|nr:TetR/AcrR family transcriptional regulator [Nonomuraea africana]MBE1559499.1 AcrR family transcriptional regulator [Nonomuraea africana]